MYFVVQLFLMSCEKILRRMRQVIIRKRRNEEIAMTIVWLHPQRDLRIRIACLFRCGDKVLW